MNIFESAKQQGKKDYATGRPISYGQKNRGLGGATLSAWTEGFLEEHKSRVTDESGIAKYKEMTGKNISETE